MNMLKLPRVKVRPSLRHYINYLTSIQVQSGPYIFLVTTTVSDNEILLEWEPSFSNYIGFSIERSLTGIDGWQEITVLLEDVWQYSDTDVNPATAYWYRVRAILL